MLAACHFDVETDGLHQGAQITCAATRVGTTTVLWHSDYAEYMTPADLSRLVDYLCAQANVVTYNGANFDFRVLYHATADERVLDLTDRHTDLCLCWAAQHGYFAPLSSFLAVNGLATKTGSGKDAIETWREGTETEKDGVLDYCANDVICLQALYNLILGGGRSVYRSTKAGHRQVWRGAVVEPAVAALRRFAASPPDTRWMRSPPVLEDSVRWKSDVPNRLRQFPKDRLGSADEARCYRASRSVAAYTAHVADQVGSLTVFNDR